LLQVSSRAKEGNSMSYDQFEARVSSTPQPLKPTQSRHASTDWFKEADPALVRLGRRPHNKQPECANWNYLRHANQPMETIVQSTRTTVFKKGFERKRDIGQDRLRIERDHQKEQSFQKFAPQRRANLDNLDRGYNAFDIITGQQNPEMERNVRRQMKHCDETKSRGLQAEGAISLRDSTSRFYGPPPGARDQPKHGNRVGLVVTEGLKAPKYSSVLGIGRSEMPSYGVADAFSHSLYGGRSILGETAQTSMGRPPSDSQIF